MTKIPRKRTRMHPADRKSDILDRTAHIVASEGVSAVSMERVAKEAGVSRALMYSYYPNATALLQQLLLRETLSLRKRQRSEGEENPDFEKYIYVITSLTLQQISEKGDCIGKLMSEAAVVEILTPRLSEFRKSSGLFVAGRIVEAYSIPMPLAVRVADIAMGITARAGDHMKKYGVPLAEITDIAVTMILGAIRHAAEKYRVVEGA